ncbi:scavenger receptor class B member 1 [Anticarsia gemmatalis]|uniref:scavenger receptor class B member 1 n=1 Tax=Anticarsia gemmatalis TaxID=129554 RepID=UPI003F767C57
MVVGTLQQVPSKGRISIMKIQNFTVQKRHSVLKLSYGFLLVVIGIIMAAINPIEIITNWVLDMREGSFLYNMWENPTYELFNEVWVFNYTNVPEYLSGAEKVMRVKEVGPFRYKEVRTNENMTIDRERGVLSMMPRLHLEFLRDESLGDPSDIKITVPNIPLIAISTLAADKLGYLANAGAYYSMTALGSKVFKDLNIEQLLWGYYDPIVTIANGLLPGWIDFKKIGILDRLYADRNEPAEVELKNASRRYSLNTWANSIGLVEQGYKDWNTSILCNRIKGTYEGIMLPAHFEKGRNFTVFRKQACRTLPFYFVNETASEFGFNAYRFTMEQSAFSRSSPYDCKCTDDCLPEGFIDIRNCYYGFPIAITKPHYLGVDPKHLAYFEGMTPNPEEHNSFYELEPTLGAPLRFGIKVQINLAVRTSPGNPITAPVKDRILPILWFQLQCKSPPPEIISLLKLRLVIGPPLYITAVVFLFFIGFTLAALGFYRVWKPKYKIIPPSEPPAPIIRRRSQERRRSSVHENIAFKIDDDELAKEAVSLLAINEEEGDFVELLISDDNEMECEEF